MYTLRAINCCLVTFTIGFQVMVLEAGEPPAPKLLELGSIQLTARIRVVERQRERPTIIDLQLRRNLVGAGPLYVADPFFTCQWPVYSAIYWYDAEGERKGMTVMPPLRNWDGETQGRVFRPGEIYGRRLGLSMRSRFVAANPTLIRMRMQLVLFEGIATKSERLPFVRSSPTYEIVAASELIDLGEVPSDSEISLVDLGFGEDSVYTNSGLTLRLDGPESCTSQSKFASADVVLYNNSHVQLPLFDPGQRTYGHEVSPIEREVVSIPDSQRVFYSQDGIVPLSRTSTAFDLSPDGLDTDEIMKLPPHTFCGRSQPWLDTAHQGKFRLKLSVHEWIVCTLRNGQYVRGSRFPSPIAGSAVLDYEVK